MNQPLFFISNPNRSEQFCLETRIWKNKNGLFAEKRAATPAAVNHLEQVAKNYDALKDLSSLNKVINIVPASQTKTTVTFEYVAGESAERALINATLDGQEKTAIEYIGKLHLALDSLPRTSRIPTNNPEFVSIFGDSYTKKVDCVKLGLVDLNFDNIVIDAKGAWHLIDYEWVFDFAVPKKYLKQRLLWYFLVRHQEILQYHANRIESLAVADGVVVPKFMYTKYRDLFDDLEKMQRSEISFQKYVMGNDFKSRQPVKLHEKPTPAKRPSVGMDNIIRTARVDMPARIQKLEEKNEKLRKEKESILSSKSYRFARKLASLKQRALLR